jgi:glycosyltransferase involved in cell wall biosynthesis
MNILFVTPYVPSRLRGRPYGFIRELARQGHAVVLACLVQPPGEARNLTEIAPYCQAVHPVFPTRFEPCLRLLASLPTRVPLSVAWCRSAGFERLVAGLARRRSFDLLHTEFVRAAPATLQIDGLPKVYDAVDSLALAYRRSLFAREVPPRQRAVVLLELLKMRVFEIWVLSHYHQLLASSPVDQLALERGGHRLTVIPNGVDLEYFAYHASPRSEATLLFLGKMSYYVNVASVLWFYRCVLPQVRRRFPQVRLEIVGRNPAPAIRRLAADPAVHVAGAVPDVRPYLARATLAVCPMVSGSGTQFKLLEAMASGAPVVSSTHSYQGLWAAAGRDLLVAGNPGDFAAAVLELLENPGLRSQLARNGRQYVQDHHSWEQAGVQLGRVYATLPR